MQASAVHHQPRFQFAGRILHDHPIFVTKHSGHFGTHFEFASGRLDLLCHAFGHLPIVDNPRIGDVNRLHPQHVRLKLFQTFGTDPFAANIVGEASFINPLQLRDLIRRHRHDDLAATIKRNIFLLAELFHRQPSLAAIRGAERTGLIVDP